jgi:hypothetical protein
MQMTPINRRELLIAIAAVAGSCRAEPQAAVVTLAIKGML